MYFWCKDVSAIEFASTEIEAAVRQGLAESGIKEG